MKRNLILTLLACGAGLVLSASAQAQSTDTAVTTSTSATPTASAPAAPDEGPEGHHKGGGMLRHLTDTLGLSGTQQAAVAQVLEAAKPQMKALREKEKADRDALIDSVSAQITPLLNPDQQSKFGEMVQKLKNRPEMGAHPGAAREGLSKHGGKEGVEAQLQRMTTTLGLTADQQTQIKPILQAARKQVKTIFANTSLTQEQKFAQFKQTIQATHSQINGLLTVPQQAQFAALKEKFQRRRHGQEEAPATPSVSGTTST